MKSTTMSRPSNHKKAPPAGNTSLLVQHLFKSFLTTALIGALLLLVCSLIAYFTADPAHWAKPLGWSAAIITAFLGGWIALRMHGKSALLCGLGNGALLLLVGWLLSACLEDAPSLPLWQALLFRGVFLLLSLAGAYLGRSSGEPKKRKHRH